MSENLFEIMDRVGYDIAWCPGCGNYQIRNALKMALSGVGLRPHDVVLVSGIGQAAKMPHYVRANVFNGLHGRSLPAAMAIKAANPGLTVIAESGDGCMYGEGGNHLVHTILRNPDIKVFVHNNMVYGLTKGQASPTSRRGFFSSLQPASGHGTANEPFNPLALAVALGASLVARAFSGDVAETAEIMKQAIKHRGFALVDIFQPCVTYNRLNTFKWFKEKTYYLDGSHDPGNQSAASAKAQETERYPLGIFYVNQDRLTFEETCGVYELDKRPLFEREVNMEGLQSLIESMRR